MKKVDANDFKTIYSLLTKKNKEQTIDKFFHVEIPVVQKIWTTIVGEALSVHSLPYKVYKKELFVRVDHPLYSQQLQFHQKKILQRLLDYNIEVDKLKVTIGTIYWNKEIKTKVQDSLSLSNSLTQLREDKTLSKMWDQLLEKIENY